MKAALLTAVLLLCACEAPPEPFVHVPLRGAHAELTCASCHGEALGPEPTTCSGCHEQDRPQPHHDGDCGDCHSEDGWPLATADHSFFPLTLGHDGPTCLDCHVEGDFAAADPTCSSCHQRPANHFPGACSDCHTTAGWGGADFDHDDFFPIPHQGVNECASCHQQAPDFAAAFTCTDCHAHRRSRMDAEHAGETNQYRYESSACLDCHPRGRE